VSRDFHLGDVLSITTGLLVAPRGVKALYDILGFMTGETLYTHQLPRASRECAIALLAQHPQLANVSADGVNRTTWRAWLADCVQQFGESLPVTPLPPREAQYDTEALALL